MFNRMKPLLVVGALLVGILLLVQTGAATPEPEESTVEWTRAIDELGFGDRHNDLAWSMKWWKGKLYLGTGRDFLCWSQAALHEQLPLIPYPPTDPDSPCTDPIDAMPLRAEIWRLTPETGQWERLFQSPEIVPIPGKDYFTARDVGFRTMAVFTEANGTESLYVGGFYPHIINPDNHPPPRILRTTDGVTFEAIPQDPGTMFGDFDKPSVRSMAVYNGRLYFVAGRVNGRGAVWESSSPAGGNDNFTQVTPDGVEVFDQAVFNGYLYWGTNNIGEGLPQPPLGAEMSGMDLDASVAITLPERIGYGVLKTDATGAPPYSYTVVITDGGYLEPKPSQGVVSMHPFKGQLYVGTDTPAEMVRINPDDTWDLVVGEPRETPDGWKYPLSGMDAGFDWALNVHIWRMAEHEGYLYAGTADQSSRGHNIPKVVELIGDKFGFDLYRSEDGVYWSPITIDGFGDLWQIGARTFASTPFGLYLGTVSFWYGFDVWQGTTVLPVFYTYLPAIMTADGSQEALGSGESLPGAGQLSPGMVLLRAPDRLEAESVDGTVVLSWDRPRGAARFQILRADPVSATELQAMDLDVDGWLPGAFTQIAITNDSVFVDEGVGPQQPYHYLVLAEDAAGRVSLPSNVARAPSLAPSVTFASVKNTILDWSKRGRFSTQAAAVDLQALLDEASGMVEQGNPRGALHALDDARSRVRSGGALASWLVQDLDIQIGKLARRVALVQDGLLEPAVLD